MNARTIAAAIITATDTIIVNYRNRCTLHLKEVRRMLVQGAVAFKLTGITHSKVTLSVT